MSKATPRVPSGNRARNGSHVRAELVTPCRKRTGSPCPGRSRSRVRAEGRSRKRSSMAAATPPAYSAGSDAEREEDRADEAGNQAVDAERRQGVGFEVPQQE